MANDIINLIIAITGLVCAIISAVCAIISCIKEKNINQMKSEVDKMNVEIKKNIYNVQKDDHSQHITYNYNMPSNSIVNPDNVNNEITKLHNNKENDDESI
jgi:glutamine amidotransferase PdxT